MNRRTTPGVADRLLGISIAVSLIGLVAVSTPPAEFAAIVTSFAAEHRASSVVSAALMTSHGRPGDREADLSVSWDPLKMVPTSPASNLVDRDTLGGQGDVRLYLRDTAAAAHRYPWAGPWRGETRTDLWVNAPRFIGSTSPPEVSPANHSVEQ